MGADVSGGQDNVGALKRVLVRAPQPSDHLFWREYGWRAEPDPARAAAEHEALRAELELSGCEVVVGTTPLEGNPDAIYAYDPALLTEGGAILLRPGKAGRRGEPAALGRDLEDVGVPIAGRLEEPATAEGGDLFWLDERTLIAGRSYRTNDAGIEAIRTLVPDVAFDLPHVRGDAECLHLLSLLSPLDKDLVVAFPRLMPIRLTQLLRDRGVQLVEVPEEEFETMGPNVLALGPRVALALEDNAETRRRMESAGVDVRTYRGDEISRKGDGGPTCLTRPLVRG
jgi:N-dimethylarginine dimethylaminohydrolase